MGRDGMKWSRESLPTAFEIVVTLDRPLCNAYETAAVMYLMPWSDPRWPQTLEEKVDITFLEAGVTTIIWDKYCVPAQFDLEPPTPPTIAPWGPYPGGLVFPATDLTGSNGSAIQYLGGGDHCTSTMTTTTTTEPDGSTTSTSAPEVGGSTPTLVEGGATTTVGGTAAAVGGSTTTRTGNSGGATVSVAG